MSRCFPYPPPGYALSKASKDALIESIKFQNGRVKSKEHKKEKRKEKKDKRQEKKDEKRKSHNPDKSHHLQTQFIEKSWTETKSEFLPKGNKSESEQLERSGLTEEHSNPLILRAPSTSSDSTENSNKRKRHSSPLDATRGKGNKIIRIKLPLKKQKITDATAIEQQPCSTSGRPNVITPNEDVICSRNAWEQVCSTSQPTNKTSVAPKTPKKPTNEVLTPMQRAEFEYQSLMDSLESLMDSLVPPQPLNNADDLDWLLKGKNLESSLEKKRISENDSTPCSISWGLWPKAQYLQEVDVYALPYTVPF